MIQKTPSRDAVILVHGLGGNQLVMAPLARTLGRAYSEVVNWGYSSLWSPIELHGQRLAALIKGLEGQVERVHIVAHSMGGIITRLALTEFQPQRLGRLVMVAPPNRGSHVATWLAPWLGRICPPLVQLADYQDSLVCRLPLPQVSELGVIAAAADFLVREPSTHLGCETDHITLAGLHSEILWRRETADQVRHFLDHGRFRRPA